MLHQLKRKQTYTDFKENFVVFFTETIYEKGKCL